MASDNETVAGIIVEVRTINPCNEYADRIEAAHKREITAKDDERLTIVANYENIIADKDAVIAELRKCLKEAVREKCPFTRMSCRYGEPCDYECGTKKWRKALEGVNNGK